jgi:hypothetical protein
MHEGTQKTVRSLVGDFEIVDQAEMVFGGWEMDETAWLIRVKETGFLKLVHTNHGGAYIADASLLEDQIFTNLIIVTDQQRILAKMQAQAEA